MLKAAEDGEEAVAWAENQREWQRINTTCDAQEGTRVRREGCTAVDRHLIHATSGPDARTRPLSSVVVGQPRSSQKWTALSLERIAAQLSLF